MGTAPADLAGPGGDGGVRRRTARRRRGRALTVPPVPRPPDLDAVRDSYDRVADNYVDMVVATGLGDVRTHPWLRAAMDTFADAVAGRGPVLDVGCGPGQVTAHLVERGVDASGMDLSPAMIAHARRLYPHCRFSVGSATELAVPDASLAGATIHHAFGVLDPVSFGLQTVSESVPVLLFP